MDYTDEEPGRNSGSNSIYHICSKLLYNHSQNVQESSWLKCPRTEKDEKQQQQIKHKSQVPSVQENWPDIIVSTPLFAWLLQELA